VGPPIFHGVRGARGIDNFFWGLKVYFKVMDIKDDAPR